MKRTALDHAALYRLLLRLYPARFREEYATPMEQQFRDDYREASGRAQRMKVWRAALLDVAAHAPSEVFHEVRRDLAYTIRVHRDRSTSGILAVGALALAIGAGTGVFSVVNAALIRELSFSRPDRLVELWRPATGAGKGRAAFYAWQGRSSYLTGAATFSTTDLNLERGQGALRVKAAETSANLFTLLGTQAAWGRAFTPDEDSAGKTAVAVIGYNLWQQAFGGDPGVLGTKVRLNGTPVEIIGVAPPRFDYPEGAALWIPSVFDFEHIPKRGAFFFRTVGRLSVPNLVARTMFEAEIAAANPAALEDTGENRARVIPLQHRLAGPIRPALWALTGLVAFVLLAACANVAQLLLSRASERRQEFAMRAALGASRARLIQQLITEAIALTLAAAAVGLFVAHQICRMASLIVPAQLATQNYTILDWRVALFAAGLAVGIGILFGLLPVLTGWQNTEQTLRAHTSTGGRAPTRVRRGLLAVQAGLTLTLAAGSLATGRSFLSLLDTHLGFTPANAVTLNVSLQGTAHERKEHRYYQEALTRLRAIPGVQTAGAVSALPLASDTFMAGSFKLDSGQSLGGIVVNSTSPEYFRAIGTSFLAGRDFLFGERGAVVIVNEAFADRTGLGRQIVGRTLTGSWTSAPYRIVGVVETSRFAGPSYPGVPMIYFRVEEEPPPALTLVARVAGDPEAMLTACRDAIRSIDPAVPVYDVKTLERRLSDALARPRFYTQSAFLLGALAVVVAVAGIYGSAARAVAQRRREMSIRLAIGATVPQVRALMLREALAPVTVGIVLGIAGALATGRYVENLIANASPVALSTCLAAASLLLAIGGFAAWSATARVLTIEPSDIVRAD